VVIGFDDPGRQIDVLYILSRGAVPEKNASKVIPIKFTRARARLLDAHP
jgi:hypothetical protein